MSITIRQARIEDAAKLLTAERETTQTPGLLVSRAHELTKSAFRKKIADLSKTGRYIVAERDGKIVGQLSWIRCRSRQLRMSSGSRSSCIQVSKVKALEKR